jgi:ankyrin repeat protein
MEAAQNGNKTEVCEILNQEKYIINQRDDLGYTALNWASYKGHIEVVSELLERKADIDIPNRWKDNPLTWSACQGHTQIVDKLLEKKANVNFIGNDKRTPLICAVSGKHTHIVDKLLEQKADVNLSDNRDRTPLICAAYYRSTEIVHKLLEKKAKIDSKDYNNSTVLMQVFLRKDKDQKDLEKINEITDELLKKSSDINYINHKNYHGHTALMWAAHHGCTDIVEKLLHLGADVNHADRLDRTALSDATENEHTQTADLIRTHIQEQRTYESRKKAMECVFFGTSKETPLIPMPIVLVQMMEDYLKPPGMASSLKIS